MDFTGRYAILAPTEAVWTALNDPEILKHCIPGCERLEKTSPTDFNAIVTLKIGPLKASFRGRVALSDLEPPFRADRPAPHRRRGSTDRRRLLRTLQPSLGRGKPGAGVGAGSASRSHTICAGERAHASRHHGTGDMDRRPRRRDRDLAVDLRRGAIVRISLFTTEAHS